MDSDPPPVESSDMQICEEACGIWAGFQLDQGAKRRRLIDQLTLTTCLQFGSQEVHVGKRTKQIEVSGLTFT
ncbi:hypothetical protein NDU88_002843 [Pleurodeles waltl]|uniref:Uncharacterized protein n=1 Tax=Pleurodeles waltl TaxID=8319 RepID=A0AAV7PAV9_PLEWA|nr:hypothetical protein NDU88_002843 [Pleurodeles waltl]